MIDGNDRPHRHGSCCDSIRTGTPVGRVRTERRPERGILRFVIFSKHKVSETRVIKAVFLSSVFINGNSALNVAKRTFLISLNCILRAAALQWRRIFLSYTPILFPIEGTEDCASMDMGVTLTFSFRQLCQLLRVQPFGRKEYCMIRILRRLPTRVYKAPVMLWNPRC